AVQEGFLTMQSGMSCLGYPGLSNAKGGSVGRVCHVDHRAKGYALHRCLPCQRALTSARSFFTWSLPVKRLKKTFNKVSIPALHQEADIYGAANHCSALCQGNQHAQ
ncbi:hypothetical protein H101_07976, partial [Trichophyton interdigitale H6]